MNESPGVLIASIREALASGGGPSKLVAPASDEARDGFIEAHDVVLAAWDEAPWPANLPVVELLYVKGGHRFSNMTPSGRRTALRIVVLPVADRAEAAALAVRYAGSAAAPEFLN